MLHSRRTSFWLITVLLVFAMVAPAMAVSQPALAAVDEAGESVSQPRSLRFHTDGWLDDVTPADTGRVVDEAIARVEDLTATIERRPPVDPARQAQTTAKWTVMIFLAADNNLEAAGLFDLNEMEAVGSTTDVNILVEIDRSADYVDYDGDWAESRRYLVQQDNDTEVINTQPLQNLGEINSGSADAVADFAIWGITNFPAEKYMLVLWDHGGAWISHSSDEDTGDDITLPELKAGLDRVKAETGIDKFEVLGFDMCLMGQMEVFQTIAPYAHYALGSEENEPGPGWFYVFLDELVRNPGMGGNELTGYVVDYFVTFFDEIWPYEVGLFGLGAVDLGKMDMMTGAVDQFAQVIEANPQAALSAIADARNNTISYGGFDDPQYYDVWSSIDLYTFADLLRQISDSPDVQQAAEGLMSAINEFVIHEQHNDALDGSHGLSIYFPRTIKAYKIAAFNERYPTEVPAGMASWIQFLDVFHGTVATTVTTAPDVNVLNVYPDVASIYQPAVVTLEVSGRDILDVNYAVTYIINENERAVLDFDYLVSRTTTTSGADIVDWSDGVTARTFAWEAEVPVLSDGTTETYVVMIPNRDNPDLAIVNGEYTSVRGGDTIQAQLLFDLNTRQSTALWGLNETTNGSIQPFEIQVEAGDQFRPLWLTLDADNKLSGTSFGDTLTLQSAQAISFTKVPAPTGQYSISFVAENVAGETKLAEAMIQVNNDGLDPALRGFTDLTYGVNFLYPSSWLRPRFTPDGLRLFTADLATDTILSLFPYTNVASAEETAAAVRDSWSDLQDLQVANERAVDVNGLPAFVIDYSYTFNGQGRVGAVIAIYVPAQNVGYGFDLDAPVDNPGPAQQALQALVDSINFFESAQVVGESAWQTATVADGLASFPVPSTWVQETGGSWTLYGPPNNPAVFVGLAAQQAAGQTNEQLAQFWVDQLQASVISFEILAAEPFYIANQEWALVVFTYDGDVKMAGAFFATSVGGYDYTFWIEAPDADFDQLYADVFSVSIGGFEFGG
ncbi:MAG: hypothetical protein JW966_06095 [Anaerolineae bacterium]|nr:hypothetical protein [Anaerolineae bacterium]